jgi:hypothetical protein
MNYSTNENVKVHLIFNLVFSSVLCSFPSQTRFATPKQEIGPTSWENVAIVFRTQTIEIWCGIKNPLYDNHHQKSFTTDLYHCNLWVCLKAEKSFFCSSKIMINYTLAIKWRFQKSHYANDKMVKALNVTVLMERLIFFFCSNNKK